MKNLVLFEDLKNNDSTMKEACLVGKNIFNRNLSDADIFEQYFEFLCKIASYPITIVERKFYLNEAEIALLFFSENADIDEIALETIKSCRGKLYLIVQDILITENEITEKRLQEIEKSSDATIADLVALKGRLFTTNTKSDFDSLLIQVQQKENALLKDYFTKEQKEMYDTLTSEYSSIVSQKMIELERLADVEYNKNAVKSFKHAFDTFREIEAYKDSQSQLFSLVSRNLFAYDASKLFNETLIYYNHVYSYIFSKLDDDGKYKLTQYSIDCEKIKS